MHELTLSRATTQEPYTAGAGSGKTGIAQSREGCTRLAGVVGAVLLLAGAAGCTTARRASYLVVDHHLGMVHGAMDIMSGEAEARDERIGKLRSDLEASRAALATEQDQDRAIELLSQHVALQDALLAEMLGSHGQHGCGGHKRGEHAESEQGEPEQSAAHVH